MNNKNFNSKIGVYMLAACIFTGSLFGIKMDCYAKTAYTGEINISLAGDCSLGSLSIHSYDNSFDQMYDKKGPEYFFQNVDEIFDNDDMTLVNFEGVLTTSTDLVEKQYNIKGRPEYISIIEKSGVDAVSFGNNHRIDYGEQGVSDTINAFNSIKLPYAYDNNVGVYTTSQGIRVGFVSVNEVYDGEAVEDFLKNGIASLKKMDVDIILACCHWGEECKHDITPYQSELGHKCIDWGADMVVGAHPHVLQGIEQYNGHYIIYSLGNFCFGGNKNPKDKNTMIIKCKFNFENGNLTNNGVLTVVPCTISSTTSKNDYCPKLAKGKTYNSIISRMNTYSKNMNVKILSDGTVVNK